MVAFHKFMLPHFAIILWIFRLVSVKISVHFYISIIIFFIFVALQTLLTGNFSLQGLIIYLLSFLVYKISYDFGIQKPDKSAQTVRSVFFLCLCLGLVEGIFGLHWPTSPLSGLSQYFGRSTSDLSDLSDAAVGYVKTMPTGFLGNPNTFSVFVFLCFVYLQGHLGRLNLVIMLIVLFIIVSCGARLTFFGFILYYLSYLRARNAFFLSTALLAIFTSDDLLVYYPKINELAGLLQKVFEIFYSNSFTEIIEASGSISTRVLLTINGWNLFTESLWFGNGLNGVVWNAENLGVYNKDRLVSSLHNTLLELLMDAGLIGTVFILISMWTGFVPKKIKFFKFNILRFLGIFVIVNFSSSSLLYSFPNLALLALMLVKVQCSARQITSRSEKELDPIK